MSGVNFDLANAMGFFQPQDAKDLGITAIRFPMRADQQVDPAGYRDLDIYTLGIVDRTAHDQDVWVDGLDAYQIGNEPDQRGESSWDMSTNQYDRLVEDYRGAHPGVMLIGAGLASGQPEWWSRLDSRTYRYLDGLAVHPYAKDFTDARRLLQQYKQITPNLPLWITEWWRPAREIPPFLAMLRQEVSGLIFWFCATDNMVDPMGMIDAYGGHKPEYRAWRAASVS